jgi:hypothetical protein
VNNTLIFAFAIINWLLRNQVSLSRLFKAGFTLLKLNHMLSLLNIHLMKKTTLVFPSPAELWDFFKITGTQEFHLDSAKNLVTGRFSAQEIQHAKEKMNARVHGEETNPLQGTPEK